MNPNYVGDEIDAEIDASAVYGEISGILERLNPEQRWKYLCAFFDKLGEDLADRGWVSSIEVYQHNA